MQYLVMVLTRAVNVIGTKRNPGKGRGLCRNEKRLCWQKWGGSTGHVGELAISQFACGEPTAFGLGVIVLANQESSTHYEHASAGINCLGVNGVELTSY